MAPRIATGFALFLASVLLLGLAMPATWQVERSLVIRGPSAPLHAVVSDLNTWAQWSGWSTSADPSLTFEYSGTTEGVDALQRWEGDALGWGLLRITEADPGSGIRFDLERERLASQGQLLFEEAGNDTRVVWSEEGDLGRSPVAAWRALMSDGLLGPEIEANLAGLQAYVEQRAAGAAKLEAGLLSEPADDDDSSGDDDSAVSTP